MEFTEADLAAVGKIQELKNVTPAKAKEIFRKHVLKLANQDVPDRADLVLAAIERDVEVNGDEKEGEAPVAKKKMTRFERKELSKARKAAKAAEKKAAKPKVTKKSNGKKPVTRVEHPLAELSREVELVPVEESHIYTANLFGKKHAVVWGERNRTVGANARFQSVNLSASRLAEAKAFAKANDVPVAIAVTVRVNGKLDQGYAVPLAVYQKYRTGETESFNLSGAARKAYEEEGWAGIKFSEKKAEAKAA